ncbi:MAG TPA: Clp protease N-terminal domain-containing protein [Ktedonobacteraceae bacterium]|nr:Clp protease N-terminal domain-containing protein [Ktedonobacteraceae bacterium]
MSTASSPSGGMQEIDWLAAETRELLQLAEQKARQRGAQAIYPEHLLLSLIAQHSSSISTLMRQNKLDLTVLRARTEASFPAISPASTPEGALRLAPESIECVENAIALVTYHLAKNKAAAIVLQEHLLLSLLYHPRMQKLFAGFSTRIFQLKSKLMEHESPAFVRHMEQIFLFPAPARDKQKIVHVAHLNKTRNKHVLRSIEYPDLSFQHILGLNRAKHALYKSIAFLHQPSRYQETSHGLLLLSQHPNDDLLFIRAIAGESEVPLTVVYCSVLVEMFLSEEFSGLQTRAEKAYQLMHEVFYPIKMFSHCLIYFQDLEVLALPALGQQQQSYTGWEVLLHQFLIEFDKLKQQPGTVVIAATTHPQHLHADFLRPGRLDRQVELDEPLQLRREEAKQALPAAQITCPNCKHPVQSHWKHCVYCRMTLGGRCRNCGTPYPRVSGARFCPECGGDL